MRVTDDALEELVGRINDVLEERQDELYERMCGFRLIVTYASGNVDVKKQKYGETGTWGSVCPAMSKRETYFWLRGVITGMHWTDPR